MYVCMQGPSCIKKILIAYKHFDHPHFPSQCIELLATSCLSPRMSSSSFQLPPFCVAFGYAQTTLPLYSPSKVHVFFWLRSPPSTCLAIAFVAFINVVNCILSFKGEAMSLVLGILAPCVLSCMVAACCIPCIP